MPILCGKLHRFVYANCRSVHSSGLSVLSWAMFSTFQPNSLREGVYVMPSLGTSPCRSVRIVHVRVIRDPHTGFERRG